MKDIHPKSRVDNNGNALLGAGETHIEVGQLRDRGLRRDSRRQGETIDIITDSGKGGSTTRVSSTE